MNDYYPYKEKKNAIRELHKRTGLSMNKCRKLQPKIDRFLSYTGGSATKRFSDWYNYIIKYPLMNEAIGPTCDYTWLDHLSGNIVDYIFSLRDKYVNTHIG